MERSRRNFLRLVALGVVGQQLDVDRLLWVPGQRTIFLPTEHHQLLTESQIIRMELDRVLPRIMSLFERDNVLYDILKKE